LDAPGQSKFPPVFEFLEWHLWIVRAHARCCMLCHS